MPVVELFDPPPQGMNISREAWFATSPVIRSETIRMHRELSERIPISKDRAARRRSRSLGGHWELHTLESERNPSAYQLARAAELREALAGEIAHWAAVEQHDKELAPFWEMARAAGKTLPEVLSQYIAVEQRLRRDPYGEIRRIAEAAGVDIEAWARRKLAEPEDEPEAVAV